MIWYYYDESKKYLYYNKKFKSKQQYIFDFEFYGFKSRNLTVLFRKFSFLTIFCEIEQYIF